LKNKHENRRKALQREVSKEKSYCKQTTKCMKLNLATALRIPSNKEAWLWLYRRKLGLETHVK
jgi:hypothetical protein